MPEKTVDQNPQWYRDAIIYQLHIKAFRDSNGDGIGDFRGIIEKLDYLQSLGVTAIWVLPFYPSPLRDDGYDISDYYKVNSQYGRLRDFKALLKAAHARGIRVITELVINHTSDQHPWFQRARQAKPGSVHRDYYVWSDTPEKYQDTRIIFQDFEQSNWSWDPVAKAYYWHRFYSHQPDLNFDNPRVQQEVFRVMDFWLEMGVDGVRLDAIPYLYEREGTNCENLPETHEFLKKLRKRVDEKFEDRMLLAEANQWPEDAVEYFGDGDECHMSFHFPLMPRMFMAVQMEDRFPLIDILDQTPEIPESSQWAIFLRNHDELTLEMVTDEERDYMYRVYANDPRARINLGIRRRLAPLMRKNRRKIELMNFLLFSLPGTPILYYGDEIGMGDNYYLGDRDGVRTPMQWSPDRNAGFSSANPQKLYLPVVMDPEYHYEAVNVENQEGNLSSLLWWTRRVVAMRKQFKAFGRGELEMLYPDNPKVLAFVRRYEDEAILVIANLSRYAQVTELDLSEFAGMYPEEVFSHNRYPTIGDRPYLLTLGVYDYYWFRLKEEKEGLPLSPEENLIKLREGQKWVKILDGKPGIAFRDEVLPVYLNSSRWFRGKARSRREIKITDRIVIERNNRAFLLLFVEVVYTEGPSETYFLPLTWIPSDYADPLLNSFPQALVATVQVGNEAGILYDAIFSDDFREIIYELFARRKKYKGRKGELTGFTGKPFSALNKDTDPGHSRVLSAEQSNSSVIYDDRFFLKLYRGLEEGVNPDLEISRFLTEKTAFEQIPPFAGGLEYRVEGKEPVSVGLLQGLVYNQGDAWQMTLDQLNRYFERLVSKCNDQEPMPDLPKRFPPIVNPGDEELRTTLDEFVSTFYLDMAHLLGQRTAEMHLALTPTQHGKVWAPETFSSLYQRSVYQAMRTQTRRTFMLLSKMKKQLDTSDLETADKLLDREREILFRMSRIRGEKMVSKKIRIHGDYHLGQVLFTGKDFIMIDFEGEPIRSLSERRLKRSPMRDVAGMIRSFHYAAMTGLERFRHSCSPENGSLAQWAEAWFVVVTGAFLRGYRGRLGDSGLTPFDNASFDTLLQAYLLEKATYELNYELNNRPDWVYLPMRGIEMILDQNEEE